MFQGALILSLTILHATGQIIQSQATYNAFSKYMKYAWIAFNNETDINTWSCVYCKDPTLSDTIQSVFTASSDGQSQGYVAVSPSLQSIIVAVRGSRDIQNYLSDITIVQRNLPGAPNNTEIAIHSGFWNVWQTLLPTIEPVLFAAISQFPGYDVTFVGHSLGAAVISLAAVDLSIRGIINPVVTKIFTAGSPRIGNPAFTAFVQSLAFNEIIRTVHYNDIVPHAIPRSAFYQHMSTEYWLNASGDLVSCDDVVNDGEDTNCMNTLKFITALSAPAHLLYFNLTKQV